MNETHNNFIICLDIYYNAFGIYLVFFSYLFIFLYNSIQVLEAFGNNFTSSK